MLPNENITISDFQVRVRRLGINPPGEILSNNVAWTETCPINFDYYVANVANDANDGNDGLTRLWLIMGFIHLFSMCRDVR